MKITILLLLTFLSTFTAAQQIRCGRDFSDANSKCLQSCTFPDADCPPGLHCFANLDLSPCVVDRSQTTVSPPPPVVIAPSRTAVVEGTSDSKDPHSAGEGSSSSSSHNSSSSETGSNHGTAAVVKATTTTTAAAAENKGSSSELFPSNEADQKFPVVWTIMLIIGFLFLLLAGCCRLCSRARD
ncbi:hypothetical protein BDR26DRAFT_604339 [Obelidium mucronatum]|nr:hypothetical protein BDR26DRAFT_604339 [Obelidium mucronatum]